MLKALGLMQRRNRSLNLDFRLQSERQDRLDNREL